MAVTVEKQGDLHVVGLKTYDLGYEQRVYLVFAGAPEDLAMIQAMYSRDPRSVTEHLAKVLEVGSGKFMGQYYTGYGHQSIGDCGVVAVFCENYSMLAAKAVQDNPLYSGQEASTRYLDFNIQPMHNPLGTDDGKAVLDGWLALYNRLMPEVKAAVAKERPYNPEDYKSEKQWQNAVAARAFDILRGLLPIGTTTSFAWTTNLRQARDHLFRLKWHPLEEVRALARRIFEVLYSAFPSSFTGEEMSQGGKYAVRDAYWQQEALLDHYLDADTVPLNDNVMGALTHGEVVADRSMLKLAALTGNAVDMNALATRPEGVEVSRRFIRYGTYMLAMLVDFGSYRDLQRHRNGLCPVPLVTGRFGMSGWYMGELERLLGDAWGGVKGEIDALLARVESLPGADKVAKSCYYPMGILCYCELTYSIPQVAYVAELRSGKTVHASLRPIAQQMARILAEDISGMALYADNDNDSWTAKRGDQTIEEKVA